MAHEEADGDTEYVMDDHDSASEDHHNIMSEVTDSSLSNDDSLSVEVTVLAAQASRSWTWPRSSWNRNQHRALQNANKNTL